MFKLRNKLLILATLIIVGTIMVSQQVMAEDSEETKAPVPREVSDFEYQYEQYRALYEDFKAKRDEYLKHGTLSSQNDAVAATQKILAQRAQTMRTFFYALRYQINNNDGVDITEKAKISENLDNEIGWFVSHMDDINALQNPSLSQLFEISERMQRKERDLRYLGYRAKAFDIIGRTRTIYAKFITINNNLEPYVTKGMKTEGYLDNWLDEAQSSGHKALAAIQRAENSVSKLKGASNDENEIIQVYTSIMNELETAKRHLTNGSKQQKEIAAKLIEVLPKDDSQGLSDDQAAETPAAEAQSEESAADTQQQESSPSADTNMNIEETQ